MKKNIINRISWFLLVAIIALNFLIIGKGTVCLASSNNLNNSFSLATIQIEDSVEEVLPGPGFLEKAANFIYIIYDYIRKAIIFLLERTIFRDNPKLADFYGDVASFLASLTAVYLLLLLIASAKKIIGVLLILGWVLFFVAIFLRG
ncbi:hypothetical protein IBX65_06270 [Candidatus Aerophobetes bacterium]|nr:hypothetical protein [Candidatus Aerophobetes bacterium]